MGIGREAMKNMGVIIQDVERMKIIFKNLGNEKLKSKLDLKNHIRIGLVRSKNLEEVFMEREWMEIE